MRWIWFLLAGAALTAGGCGSGTGGSKGVRISSGQERLRAGYVEIPLAGQTCAGQRTGTVTIRLQNLLGRLNASSNPAIKGNTLERHITFDTRYGVFDSTDPNAVQGEGRLSANELKGFFATQLDFTTRLLTRKGPIMLVEPGKYVMVRVVLDGATNPGVEFLRPDTPGSEKDSAFAVMASVDTAQKNMLFCRGPIKFEDPPGRNPYVEFGIQSSRLNNGTLTGPATGSFGIGLLVRDETTPYVTPIILDPAVRNEG
jgi:hypothetical protein